MLAQEFPDIEDYEQIKAKLAAHNGNVQAVVDEEKARQKLHDTYELVLINATNQSE